MISDSQRFNHAMRLIDEQNRRDPNEEEWHGKRYPKELLYSLRMTEWLHRIAPGASEALQLAARAQHICRWQIPREDFPMDRAGYLRWRNQLKQLHARLTMEIMKEAGYQQDMIEEVTAMIEKKNLKQNQDTQTLEDVVCLVFLQYYLPDFSRKKSEEKMIEILRKTWRKMSSEARQEALQLNLTDDTRRLVAEALSYNANRK
jgi:hypothetical protein